MPYLSQKMRLSESQDRRRKLTTEMQKEIVEMYATGAYSWKTLAEIFGVSKSRIGQIVNPELAEKAKERCKRHWRDYRKSGEEWNAVVREHRRYKQNLYLKGELR